MKKWLGLLMVAAMTLSVVLPAESAPRRRARQAPPPPPAEHAIGPIRTGDPRVFWSGVAAGGAATGAYIGLQHEPSLKVAGDGAHFSTGALLLTTVGCMTLAPLLASAVVWNTERRPLTSREAMSLGAGCIIPIIGPLLINSAFDSHPEWERGESRGMAPARR